MNTLDLERTITEVEPDTPAPSPFLPGTKIQFAWDSTSLGMLKTCPRLYQYVMIEGYQANEDSVHLRFGQEYHKALEEYDEQRAEGISHQDSVREAIRRLLLRTHDWEVDESIKSGKYKNRMTLLGLVIDYLDEFSADPCETYHLDDGTPAVELSFRFELDWGPQIYQQLDPDSCLVTKVDSGQPYLLCGHLDRVVDFCDNLYVMDRKTTTTTLSDYYFAQYEPNNQMTLYTLAGQMVLSSPVKGVIIDAAQIMLDKPNRFVRSFTYRTGDQLDEWLGDLRILLSQAEAYATAGHWPQNDTACDKFGGCRFRGICSKSPGVRDSFLRSGFTQLPEDERWNPLKPR